MCALLSIRGEERRGSERFDTRSFYAAAISPHGQGTRAREADGGVCVFQGGKEGGGFFISGAPAANNLCVR